MDDAEHDGQVREVEAMVAVVLAAVMVVVVRAAARAAATVAAATVAAGRELAADIPGSRRWWTPGRGDVRQRARTSRLLRCSRWPRD